ncbi:uncharacterized protein LOC132446354 [Gadus macrocephalus]|uniref:uncharacterized protein LOC132446354 n=1 Tax=Gadus macrocephalus TaxID=80720 RepID=UPI0028CB5657|nr:uncharacterized protein LOC132446354 [Gadus macrocephalus]
MLVHLLFTTLFSGIRSGNMTNSSGREELRLGGSLEESNLTLVTKHNGTVEPERAPSSRASEELAQLEAPFGLPPDAKLNLTTEEDGIRSGNVTNSSGREELRWGGSLEESNLTSVTKHNGTVEPGRAPFSRASEELAQLEAPFGLPPDAKLNLTTEEDENFQDQEEMYPHRHCHQQLLEQFIDRQCGWEFEDKMEAIGAQQWCSFDHVISPYNKLSSCLEELCAALDCYYPNPTVQEFFLLRHATYFLHCPEEGAALPDAPHALVVVLTLGPVSLIPLLVYLVIRKSNGRD